MKRIFILISIISLLSILTSKSFAQGNLQFNQVLTYSGTLTTGWNSSPSYTVPVGKVWKIEFHSVSDNYISLYLNGAVIHDVAMVGSVNAAGSVINSSPIWLKTGDVINYAGQLPNYSQQGWALSIIEFNIVP